ncbi:MAG TPA: branched-chain amino acid ABC transporter permease, partial [Rubrivivax sp.]|nr:branched-chain amino acid ABC transporter permease [Rubrivivax sp.]
MEFFTISLLNGLSYGLLRFMLSSGLTLIFSMMGVLNFAHASFYMVGAYAAYSVAQLVGFWPGLVVGPLAAGVLGALFERYCLRRVHKFGHVPELLVTFGLSYVLLDLVQLIWGRTAVDFQPPEVLRGPAFTIVNSSQTGMDLVFGAAPDTLCRAADVAVRVVCSPFPATRGFMMLVALVMLAALWLLITRTRIGLVIQSALTHPEMVEALGHNVPRVLMMVFGAGAALAGLAGVIGGSTFVTEPSMAAAVGVVIFVVVVVGGMGSLAGAFLASLLIGIL